MYVKSEPATVSFFYADEDGQPASGQVLTSIIRLDSGSWTSSTNTPREMAPALAPGFYDLALTATEMAHDHLDWYVRTQEGLFVASGQLDTVLNDELTTDLIFDAIFTAPTDPDDEALMTGFMNRLADHVLRRALANAERSTSGDQISSGSLAGVISLLTQGQLVVTNCTGDSYIFLNSSIQGNPPLGALRVVRNTAGVPIGTLPLTGPNAVPDATLNCDCP